MMLILSVQVSTEEAVRDFRTRIQMYERVYETVRLERETTLVCDSS